MNSFYKYLIFFILGIILSLIIFKKDLVEGYLKINDLVQEGTIVDGDNYVVKNLNDKLSGTFTIDVETINVSEDDEEDNQRFLRVSGLICDSSTAIRGGDAIGGPIVAHSLIPCARYLKGDRVMNPQHGGSANTFAFVGPPDPTYHAARCKIFNNNTLSCSDSVDQHYKIYTKCNGSNSGVILNASSGDVIMKCGTCPDGYLNLDPDNSPYCTQCPDGTIPNYEQTRCEPCPAGTRPNGEQTSCELCPAGTFNTNGSGCQSIPDNSEPLCHISYTNAGRSDLRPCSQTDFRYLVSERNDDRRSQNLKNFVNDGRSIDKLQLATIDSRHTYIYNDKNASERRGSLNRRNRIMILDETNVNGQRAYFVRTKNLSDGRGGSIEDEDYRGSYLFDGWIVDSDNSLQLTDIRPLPGIAGWSCRGNETTDGNACLGPGLNTDGSACQDGTYSPDENTGCLLCPAGTTSNDTNTGCLGPGYDTDGSVCEDGFYSPNDETGCTQCPEGTTSNDDKTGCLGPGYDTSGNPCEDGTYSPGASSGCLSCELPNHPNIAKTQCVSCPDGIFNTQDIRQECIPCTGNLVPDINHENCLECNRPENQEIMDSDGTQQYASRSGPGYISNSNNTECLNPFCSLPEISENTTMYNILDENGDIVTNETPIEKDNFNITGTCSDIAIGTANILPCNEGGGEIILSGCYPENTINKNSKCGDFKNDPFNLTEKCKNKIVLENKECDTIEKCLSTEYCCSPDISNKIKQLSNEIYFSDNYELINPNIIEDSPIEDFNNWYEDVNNRIQQLQTTPDSRDLTETELRTITLKPELLSLFTSEDGKYQNKENFENNWIGSGGGQEEKASDVWKRLIQTINYNRKFTNTIDQNLSNLTEEDLERDLKLLLINLDKPIRNTDSKIDLTYKYPINNDTSGLSPLDLFLYNDPEGISSSQLESLL